MRSRAGAGQAIIERLQRVAADALAAAGGDAPFALLDFPDHPNVGDSAIWLGTTAFFREYRGAQPAYVASTRNLSESELRDAVPDGPIFIHGGGNFGDLWPRHHEFRERLLERFPDREIIQLPQSIHFEDPALAARTARLIARHGRFRLFARDRPSYEFATARFDCEVALCPDMALFLGPLDRKPAEVDVLYLLRTDKERMVREPVGPTGSYWVVDWLEDERASLELARFRSVLRELLRGRGDPNALRIADYEATARARVRRGCRLLSAGRAVITDRLHGHLLCLLLGIPHAVLENSYGKLGRFLEIWTGGAAGVHRAASTDDAELWAAAAACGAD
jgi:exopolysaccharide biosynthesis predicted pyruvyltransferase EpsI